MFLIELLIVLYLLCLIYFMIVGVLIELIPMVAYLCTTPHTLTDHGLRWLQTRLYGSPTAKQELCREVIARAVSVIVYLLIAYHFDFSTGWMLFAAFIGLTAVRYR